MASIGEGSETGNIRNVIRIDEGEIRNHLDGLVKTSVEEVLNQYLDQEAYQLCGAKRYEQSSSVPWSTHQQKKIGRWSGVRSRWDGLLAQRLTGLGFFGGGVATAGLVLASRRWVFRSSSCCRSMGWSGSQPLQRNKRLMSLRRSGSNRSCCLSATAVINSSTSEK